jgi:SAM-dependent methyltransferase/uncharacterized protein YbaR (Trm112 family)
MASVDAALLALLRCPFCGTAVEESGESLSCTSCGRSFAVESGIPLMLHPDLPGAAAKLGETAGWVEKARGEGWYEPDDHIDSHLPFLTRDLQWEDPAWWANEYSFGVLLDKRAERAPGMRVLELGAAKCWAAPYWRERGAEYVATDILVDERIGLGRGSFYGDFSRVQADGEHLPFPDETFDATYCVATLHHALDPMRMVGEMSRVTKPGGIVTVLNEGTRGVLRSGENPDQEAEKELGINEHVPTIWTYVAAFVRAGLQIRCIERADGWPPGRVGAKLTRVPKLGPTLGALAHVSASRYTGVTIYARKRHRSRQR